MGRYNTFPFFRVHVGPSPFDPKTNVIQVSEINTDNYPEVLGMKNQLHSS